MYENELYHYGVKGMKWGVRRYQNTDGTYTTAGKKRRNNDNSSDITKLAKKLADGDLSVNKKMRKADEEYNRKLKDIKEPDDWNSDEAWDYLEKTNKLYDKYNNKYEKLYKEQDEEIKNLRESIFLSDNIKSKVSQAKELHKSIDTMYDETVGYKSKAYEDAWKKYYKSITDKDLLDDAEYGFDHYYWPQSKEKEQAVADYNKKSSLLKKEYEDIITNIGKTITEGYGDQKMSDQDWFKNYEEWGRNEVDEIIRFNRIKL